MRQGQLSRGTAGHLGSRRYLVERGDTGLGRDAYGPPERHAYGLDDGYQPPPFESGKRTRRQEQANR